MKTEDGTIMYKWNQEKRYFKLHGISF